MEEIEFLPIKNTLLTLLPEKSRSKKDEKQKEKEETLVTKVSRIPEEITN